MKLNKELLAKVLLTLLDELQNLPEAELNSLLLETQTPTEEAKSKSTEEEIKAKINNKPALTEAQLFELASKITMALAPTKKDELKALFDEYGATRLGLVPKDKLPEVLAELEKLQAEAGVCQTTQS